MTGSIPDLLYLLAATMFIFAVKGLSTPDTARRGNIIGMIAMAIAIITTILTPDVNKIGLIITAIGIGSIIGISVALKVKMTAMPQLVAIFNSLGGLAAVPVSASALYLPEAYGITADNMLISYIEIIAGTAIGAITFTGSIIAFAKLQGIMSSAPVKYKGQNFINATVAIAILVCSVLFCITGSEIFFWIAAILAFAIGIMVVIPIGGADMPVIIAMLNSYSGWAAASVGFTIGNNLLIITGALVGSSGAILSYIMCKAMNRSFLNVMFGGFGTDVSATGGASAVEDDRPVKRGAADDAAYIMKNASSVIIVPGYGMAVAQAQHALREMADILESKGVDVKYAIHPVAGRMPGHMNVLLAEANVSYDKVFELDDINRDFKTTDVVYVIGANDVTNPAAKNDPQSPIYGMPVLDVEDAKTVLFIKRGMGVGYAGIQNELFFKENTMMLFADAKKMTEDIVKAL